MDGPDAQWWGAVRVLLNRALDSLETVARADPELAQAIARVLGHSAGPAEGTTDQHQGRGLPEVEPTPSPPAVSVGVDLPPEGLPALVERVLRLGDTGQFTVKALEEKNPPAAVRDGPPGPQLVRAAPPEGAHPLLEEEYDATRITRCCRLKAEACRWQGERSARLDAGSDVRDADHALVSRAARDGCWLWMVQPARWRERGERAFAVVAGSYDALADAVALVGVADANHQLTEEAMTLLAEACSALRAAIEDYASTGRDRDQQAVFKWLDRETHVRSVYIGRHMRLDDPASPENHPDLRRRIAELRERLESLGQTRRARENLFGKVTYAIKKLQQSFPASEPFDPAHPQMVSLEQAVRGLLEDGLPASNRRLRELLMPILDRVSDNQDGPLGRVLEEIDTHLDQLAQNAGEESGEGAPDTGLHERTDDLLQQARTLLHGRHAVLIGGKPDEQHRQRLESNLELASLRWLHVRHGSSFESDAEPALSDPEVTLVLIMTRWRSHRDGPAARRICKQRSIPLVELTGGYGSRRVAHEVLQQAGRLLPASA